LSLLFGHFLSARREFLSITPRNDILFLEFMGAHFGKGGVYYYWISRGIDIRDVRANRIRKSVGAFASDLTEFEPMVAELQPLIDKVWRHCKGKRHAAGW
jgi:nucleotidyltransferase/DNA polymerase involved in DNA repair